MDDREPGIEAPPIEPRRNIADDVERAAEGVGGPGDDSPGMPGGTLGTGDAREEDR